MPHNDYAPNALVFADEAQNELLTAGHVSDPAYIRSGTIRFPVHLFRLLGVVGSPGILLRVQDRNGREEWYPITHVRLAPASPAEDRARNAAQGAI